MLPTRRPLYSAPCAWHASSITTSPCLPRDRRESDPCRPAARRGAPASIALVRGVIAASSCARIHRERLRIDVDEHRPCAGVADRRDGGDEGERHRDHFVAGADAGGEQRQMQRARAGVHGDAVIGADSSAANSCFERGDFGAEDELPAVEDAGDGRLDLRLDAGVLRLADRETESCCAPAWRRVRRRGRVARSTAWRPRGCGRRAGPRARRSAASGRVSMQRDEMRRLRCCSASVMSSCGAHMSPVR